MTAPESELRADLAAAFRWAARLNLHEAVANHFSVAVSDDGQRFLAVSGDPTSVSGNLSSAPLKIDVIQLEVSSRF